MASLCDLNQKSPEFIEAVRSFSENPKGFFLISGKNGNGKTFAARALFKDFHDPWMNKQFWNMAQLNMHWLKTYQEYGDTSYILSEILKAPLLVLDDVGTRKPSDGFMDFLYCIADDRYENRSTKGTILTTNLTSQAMREMMGDAFMSRVASGKCLRWDGKDRRGES